MIVTMVVTALLWSGIMGQLSAGNVLCGAALGFVLDRWLRRMDVAGSSARRLSLVRALVALPRFLLDLVIANLVMAREVLRPAKDLKPGFVVIPIDAMSDMETTIATHWITLTPGTMTVDVAPERGLLAVHVMQGDDITRVRADLLNGPIAQSKRLFRP